MNGFVQGLGDVRHHTVGWDRALDIHIFGNQSEFREGRVGEAKAQTGLPGFHSNQNDIHIISLVAPMIRS